MEPRDEVKPEKQPASEAEAANRQAREFLAASHDALGMRPMSGPAVQALAVLVSEMLSAKEDR